MKIQRLAYVLQIFPKLSETFIAGELAELRRRGVEVRILSLLPPRAEVQHDIVHRAGLAELTTYDVDAFPSVVRAFRPQLLHAHFATDATAKARELAARCELPFTFTAHGYDIHRKPPPDFRERALAARAVVTVSEANKAYLARTFGVPEARVRVIPCGVDTERFCPAIRSRRRPSAPTEVGPDRGPRSPTPAGPEAWVVCVARQVKVKNLRLLLDACAELRRRRVAFRCAMIGDGPLHGELKAKRAELGLDNVVAMPGAAEQGEVLQWWRRAAVGVLTSEHEGMPVSLMEAAACGVPVVATRVGGVPELVRDGETGLLAPAGDAAALADALAKMLGDASWRARLGAAARRRAEENFSVRHQGDQLLALWAEVVADGTPGRSAFSDTSEGEQSNQIGAPVGATPVQPRIPVSDPFGAAGDAELPTLAHALNPVEAARRFKRRLPKLSGDGQLRLLAIRVTRHKPRRRCVIEYEVEVDRPDAPKATVTLIGKIRARRYGNEGFRQLETIWKAGFDAHSADGVSVPEPVGVISPFKMWCQRKAPGGTAERLLADADGPRLARRIAEAIHKLHRANLPTERRHTMADELEILRECLAKVAERRADLAARVARVLAACERLGASVPAPAASGIHRDFYPAQVIVDGERLWLIDFDLFCLGDPGLDAGNFLGHVIEQALRERGDARALGTVEQAMEERFVQLSGAHTRAAVRAYTTLTLARHIFLSTEFPERSHTTEALVALCEGRLQDY